MEDVPTIGGYLNARGYTSALVGKAHFQPLLGSQNYPSLESYPVLHDLDFWRNFEGPYYGFDHIELARNHTDESHAGQHYALWMESKGHANWRDYFLPTNTRQTHPEDNLTDSSHTKPAPGQPWDIPEEIHYNAWIAERTGALMSSYAAENRPFFLWASFFDPHPQYMVPEPYASMYDPGSITVPEHVEGEFNDKPFYFKRALLEKPDFSDFDELEGNGIHGSGSHLIKREDKAKNIAAMYGMMSMMDVYIGKILDTLDSLELTENTLVCFTSDHGDFFGQHGLTQKAIHHYEDLLRVPLVVSLPGVIPQKTVSLSLQSTVDLAPTFLGMAGLEIPRSMAGIDQTSVWTGKKETIRDHVIIENQHQPTTMNLRTFVENRYKLTVHYNRDYGELYDLKEDPREMINLWDNPEYQKIKSDLLLRFLYGEMAKAPLPMPRISGA